MKYVTAAILIVFMLVSPVSAAELTAPEVPESGAEFMPAQPETFSEGILYIIRQAFPLLHPAAAEASRTCLMLLGAVLLVSICNAFPGAPNHLLQIMGAVTAAGILLRPSRSLISLARDTVTEISQYGKLLLPVMAGTLTAGGGVTSSSALYMGTAFFDAILCAVIEKLIVPMVYLFLCLGVGNSATGEDILEKMKGFLKWLMTWSLKIVLYVFTGFMGITGVVSGHADAAALKAAKLTISGAVPVVGGILSDASEAVLVSAGLMKNAAGIYGILAVAAILIAPFLKIGVQYLLLKITAAICAMFDQKPVSSLIQDFSSAMGIMLAMTGAVSIMFLISIICFLKGVS